MRVLVQRVSEASVVVNNEIIGAINKGLLLLVGIENEDSSEDINWLVKKIAKLRIFSDDEGKMNLSVQDVNGGVLVVSQFTLHASTKKGTRPSFIKAAKPDHAIPLFNEFIKAMNTEVSKVETGEFGADMKVNLTNDGPVTIWLDTKNKE